MESGVEGNQQKLFLVMKRRDDNGVSKKKKPLQNSPSEQTE